ncbi:hydroxyisourate hydrolase [Arthrobacter roseus]|uniref:hydroxyisourate hydrolase n=1 Tax=Arthrobacter roseus TaxID=136274 RepID=UPI001963828C|nr:hydroxyisourate hydrolase [Arthrobacter roseus]MBM7847010.1 5-hydroxyisourate hydrolase [Arthrobacter roseus]
MTSHITTHVLDTGSGRPAVGVAATLGVRNDAGWSQIAEGITDGDGRIKDLGPEQVDAGDYRIEFQTGAYFGSSDTETFFPTVTLTFSLTDPTQHYHVPLLISPFAYSTYRGS